MRLNTGPKALTLPWANAWAAFLVDCPSYPRQLPGHLGELLPGGGGIIHPPGYGEAMSGWQALRPAGGRGRRGEVEEEARSRAAGRGDTRPRSMSGLMSLHPHWRGKSRSFAVMWVGVNLGSL